MPLSDLDTPDEGEGEEQERPSGPSGWPPSLAVPSMEPDEPDDEDFGLPSHVLALALGDLPASPEPPTEPPLRPPTPSSCPVVLGAVHSLSQNPDLFSEIEVDEHDWSCLEPPARLSASFHQPNVSQDPVGQEALVREAVLADPRILSLRLSLPKIDDLAHVNSRGRVDLKRLKRAQPQLFCRRRPPASRAPKARQAPPKTPRAPRQPRPALPPSPAVSLPAPALSAVLVQYSSSDSDDSDDSELEELRKKHRPVAPMADDARQSPRASQSLKRQRGSSPPQSEPDPPPRAKKRNKDLVVVPRPPSRVGLQKAAVVRDSDPLSRERVDDPAVVVQRSPGPPPAPHPSDDGMWHEPGPLNLAFFDSTHDLRKFKKLLLVELHHHCEFLGKKATGISFAALERRIQSALDRIQARKPVIPARPAQSAHTLVTGPDQSLRIGAGIQREARIQLSDVRKVGSPHEKAFQLAWPQFERTLERRARQRQESLAFCLKMIKKFLDTRELYSRAKRESEAKRDNPSRNRKIVSDDSDSNEDGDRVQSRSSATSRRSKSPDPRPGVESDRKTKPSSPITQMGKGFKIPKAEGKSKDKSKEASMKSILKEEPAKANSSKGQSPATAKSPSSKQYNHSYQKPRDPNPPRLSTNKKPTFSSAAVKGVQSFDLLNVVSGMRDNVKRKEPRTDPRIKELHKRALPKTGPHSDPSHQSKHRPNSHTVNGQRENSLGPDRPERLPLKVTGDDEVDEVLSRRMRDPNGQDFSTVIAWREPGSTPIMFKCRVCNLLIQGKADLMHHVVGFRHHTNFKRHTALPPRDRPRSAVDRPPSGSVGDGTPPGDDDRDDDSPTPGASQSTEAQPPVMNILPVPSQVWDMPKFSLPLPVPSLPKPVPSTRSSSGSVPLKSLTSSTSPMQSSTEALRPRPFIPGLPTPIPVPVAIPDPAASCPVSHSSLPAPSPLLPPSPSPRSPAAKPGLSKADLEKLPPPMRMSERVKNHLSRAHWHAKVNPLDGDQSPSGSKDASVHSNQTKDEGAVEAAQGNSTKPKAEQEQPDLGPKGNDTPEGGYYEPGDQTPLWDPPSTTASDQATSLVNKPDSESFGEFNIDTSKSFLDETHQNAEDAQALLERSKLQVKDANKLINPAESDPAKLIGQDFSSLLNKVIHTLAKSTKGPVDVVPTPPPSTDPPPPPLPTSEAVPAPSSPLLETPVNPLTDSNVTRVPPPSNLHVTAGEAASQAENHWTHKHLGANHAGEAGPGAPPASSQLKPHSNSTRVTAPPPPAQNPRAQDMTGPSSGSISDVEINSFINQWCHQSPAQPTTSTELVTPTAPAQKEPVLSSALAKLRARKAQKKVAQAEVTSSTGGRSSPHGSDISECSNASGQNFLSAANPYNRQYPPPPPPLPPPLPPSAHHQHQLQQRQPFASPYHSGVGNGWGGAQPPLPHLPPPPPSHPPPSSYLHPFPSHYQRPPLPPSQQTYWPR